MSRTIYTANQADLKIIKSFLKRVSWGSECILCQWLDGSKAYLLIPNLYILVPCYWFDFEKTKQAVTDTANSFGVKPGLILYGECTHHDCDRVSWQAIKEGFVVYWLEVENCVRYNRLIARGLDGFDWWNQLGALS